MGHATERLSDIECKRAKPREKAYKLSDGGGLMLLVKPDGPPVESFMASRNVHEAPKTSKWINHLEVFS